MATIYDVAKSSGVSPKTVSRVLNNDPAVAEKTRLTVEAAMENLGYVPSYAARSMRSNRSGLVGLISGAISDTPFGPEQGGLPEIHIFHGVQKALQEAGRTLLIADTGGNFANVHPLLRTFAEHRVEGVIYVAEYHRKVELPKSPGIPEIIIANGYDTLGTPSVVPNDYLGQRMLTDRLIEAGHRRVGYLTLPVHLIATRDRTLGYRDALTAADIPYDPQLVRAAELVNEAPETQQHALEQALSGILTLKEPPTVICSGNDRMAMQLYGMLRSRGIRVPQDISVAGYDDYLLISKTLYPPLTTVELPYNRIGMAAAELLIARLGGEISDQTEPVRVSGNVAWRDSVLPLPGVA